MPQVELITGGSVPQSLSGKTLTDTFMGMTFQSYSATPRSIVLPVSTNYEIDDHLEIGASYSLEIPATTSLWIRPYNTVQGWDGWQAMNDTATYVSGAANTGSSFTVTSTTTTAMLTPGDKLKIIQGSAISYHYVTKVSGTLVTCTGGSDYFLSNSAINQWFVSHVSSPVGHPGWFNYAPTYTGFTVNPSGGVVKFSIINRLVYFSHEASTGTSNLTSMSISLPIAATSTISGVGWRIQMKGIDGGTAFANADVEISGGDTVATCYKDINGVAWTASGAKGVQGMFYYEI